jgi:nitric oxide reductase NorE protein
VTVAETVEETKPTDPRRIPGQPDMWFFVLFESLVFTSYFCIYLFFRTQNERAFLQAQSHLLLWLGVIDTVVLLTSSWAVARCVQHARARGYEAARRDALVAAGCGLVFLGLKVVEWIRLIRMGHTFTSSEFFQYYFFLTGIHLLHLLIGFCVLGVLFNQLSHPHKRSQEAMETCATYWHTVDFLWVLIFALLLGRSDGDRSDRDLSRREGSCVANAPSPDGDGRSLPISSVALPTTGAVCRCAAHRASRGPVRRGCCA